jgi:hypothetical protein
MAVKNNLDGQTLKAALEEFVEVGFCEMNIILYETQAKKRKPVHVGVYFFVPMCFLLFMMM